MKKIFLTFLFLAVTSPALAEAPALKKAPETARSETTPSETAPVGLTFRDDKAGTGVEAIKGKTVSVHYTGWLSEAGWKQGKKFDSSLDRGQPFQFILGAGQVIPGWDEGVAGMKVGGKRTLMIPSKFGYGERGAGTVIPPNADLIFEVELLDVK